MNKAPRSNPVQRYPALALVAVAALLSLLLPSALNLPQSSPAQQSEFAPVPGTGDTSAAAARYGEGSSGGLGFGMGRGRAGEVAASERLIAPTQRRPRLKRCVGDPPRQTEDPLSPPCVASFEGNNFGGTHKGVTSDEIRVVLWPNPKVGGKQDTFSDCADPPSLDDMSDASYCKAFAKFFNERYQTYGRIVKMFVYHPGSASGLSFEGHLNRIDTAKDPFAVVSFLSSNSVLVVRSASPRKILTALYNGFGRAFHRDHAPFAISFRHDREDHIAISASYLCEKLAGRPPRFAGAGIDQSRPRKFGFFSTDLSFPESFAAAVRARCDVDISDSADATRLGPNEMATLRAANVTTIIPVGFSGNIAQGTIHASELAYFPEWFIPGDASVQGIDTNRTARSFNQTQWQRAFGLSLDYRRDATQNQPWRRAYTEGCSTCPEQTSAEAAFVYDALTMLFYGIQAAGPRLTPESVDKGMHAIPQRGSPNPYRPAAYFSPGNYTFLKDSMQIFWDPTGLAPGDSRPGCYRLPHEGRRFRASEWLAGDGDAMALGPCQGTMLD